MKKKSPSPKPRTRAKREASPLGKLKGLALGDQDCLELPDDSQWTRLERMLHQRLPKDLKQLVSVFGTGVFGGRILLLNPAAEQDWRSEFSARWAHGIVSMLSGAFPNLTFFPACDGLLPIGMTAESDYLCLHLNDGTITVCSLHQRKATKTRFRLAEFLHRLLGDDMPRNHVTKTLQRQWCDPEAPAFEPKPYLR